jgi:uncharacterized protein
MTGPDRRNIFRSAIAAATGMLLARGASPAQAQAPSAGVPKVAYHLADLEKVAFALGNIRNHIAVPRQHAEPGRQVGYQ